MIETNKIVHVIKKYFESLGYDSRAINTWLMEEKIAYMFAMRLANANIVTANKTDKSSHQTHIAVTGDAISFFCDRDAFEKMSTEEVYYIQIGVSKKNVDELCLDVAEHGGEDIFFEDCKVSIGKRTQNQLQLSKKSIDNAELFNEMRNGLHENDLLVFLKTEESKKIVAIGIKERFYSKFIEDYNREFNSNTLFSFEVGTQYDVQSDLDRNMQLRVFVEKSTDSGTCYLCGCSLKEYMEHLPDSYKENAIQRGIVKNTYLDRLVKTIIGNENIPIITLIGESINVMDGGQTIELSQYRILDGLQRTFRIQEIWKCVQFFNSIESEIDAIRKMSKIQLSRYLSGLHDKYDINIFLELLDEYALNGNLDRLIKGFSRNEQWFEVWEELSLEQETEKMLILNAGHRQMDYRHQLELLFLNILPKLNSLFEDDSNVKIVRNKEKSDMQYSKQRSLGEFYFSHIISSFISYSKKQPITTNAELISKIQQDKDNEDEDISYVFIRDIMLFLVEFDKRLNEKYGEDGIKWIAKETVLVGIFAASGLHDEVEGSGSAFEFLLENVDKLNLISYNNARQMIDVNKVNMGNITKRTVMEAIQDLLNHTDDKIEWNKYFGRD